MKEPSTILTCDQLRDRDIVSYLSSLGFEPAKVRPPEYWYLSPLRSEKTASFKVNRKLNRWFDHGIGRGGNLIDFALVYHQCSLPELLRSFSSDLSLHQPSPKNEVVGSAEEREPKVTITRVRALQSLVLIRYLHSRKIPPKVAEQFCREIDYEMGGKNYYSIGFQNDAGGYEMRNAFCKNSSSPKTVSTIKNGAGKIAVLEGFFDFLSLAVILAPSEFMKWDFCVLNSLSFFEQTKLFFNQYASVHLFLDNDRAGQNCSHKAISCDTKYRDESSLYGNYKDLNEWHVTIGKGRASGLPKPP